MLQEAKEKPFICLSIYSSGKIYFSIHRFIYLRASLLGHRDYQNDDELIEKNKKLYSISKKVYTGEEFNKIIKYFPRFLKSE